MTSASEPTESLASQATNVIPFSRVNRPSARPHHNSFEYFSRFFSVHQAGVNNISAGQDICRSLRNPYSVRNSLLLVGVVYHGNLAYSFKFDFSKTLFNIILPWARTQPPVWWVPAVKRLEREANHSHSLLKLRMSGTKPLPRGAGGTLTLTLRRTLP